MCVYACMCCVPVCVFCVYTCVCCLYVHVCDVRGLLAWVLGVVLGVGRLYVKRFYDMVCRIGRVCWRVEVVYGCWRVEVLEGV